MPVGEPADLRVERARRGDVAAFTSLLRQHDDAMRALVWSMVRDRWVTDDILQSAYEKAFRSIGSFRGDSSFRTWLHRVCWTTAVDWTRHESRRRHEDIDDHGGLAPEGPGESTGAIERLGLAGALALLPEPQRTALVLVAVEGMSYDEAGSVVGATAGTIASRVSRAKERMRAVLGIGDEKGATR